jgi:hypothetical protein
MDMDEKVWLSEAVSQCLNADSKGVMVALIRRQDANDHADILVTNAKNPEMLRAAADALRSASAYDTEDEE